MINRISRRIKSVEITNDVMSKSRSLLMGLSILGIMLFHYMEDCRRYKVNENAFLEFFLDWIASSGVDVFAFLSGLGLYYSMKRDNHIRSFYKKRIVKIGIPYVLASLPAVIWRDVFAQGRGVFFAAKDFFFVTFFTEGSRWFWYIGFCLVIYAIFPYIFQILEDSRDRFTEEFRLYTLLTMITVACLVIYKTPVWDRIEIALLRLPVFIAGAFYGKSSYEKRKANWKWLVVFGLAFLIRWMDIRDPMGVIVRRYSLGALNICICFGIAVLFAWFSLKPLRMVLEWFGKYSLEIYLLHLIIREVLNKSGYYTWHIRYEMIVVCGSVALAVLLQFVTNVLSRPLLKNGNVKKGASSEKC